MINKSRSVDLQPFAGLTPEVVLDAAAACGLEPDGRLFALNSYENRVYQLGAGERQLVLKFYRPARWSDAQIGEEHELTAELAAAELPVAAPLTIGGADAAALWRVSLCRLPLAARPRPGARCARGAAAARQEPRAGCTRSARRARFACARRSVSSVSGGRRAQQVLGSELLPQALHASYASVSAALLERASGAFDAAGGRA